MCVYCDKQHTHTRLASTPHLCHRAPTEISFASSRAGGARCGGFRGVAAREGAVRRVHHLLERTARQSTSCPPYSATAARSRRRCSPRATPYSASLSFWSSRVDPSMSVNKSVTVAPDNLATCDLHDAARTGVCIICHEDGGSPEFAFASSMRA